MLARLTMALVALLAAAPARAADMLGAEQLDMHAHKAAADVIRLGVPLFNGGNREGCFRLYQGSLLALRGMLDHRPELAAMVDAKLEAAQGSGAAGDKAFALRAALDEIVKQCAPTAMTPDAKQPEAKPLWERLGGEAGVRAVTQEFLRTAAADKQANIDRNGNYPLTPQRVKRVEQLVVEFISSATGGPLKYAGRDMKNAHAGMMITADEFNAAAGHLVAALKKYDVPQAEIDELVGLVAGTAQDMVEVK